MASSPELRRSVSEVLLDYVKGRFEEHALSVRGVSGHHRHLPRPRNGPRLFLHWLTDIVSNFMVKTPLGSKPYTSQPARDEFLRLKRANRLRLVQARLDHLVDEGKLVYFKARVAHNNSMGYSQVFTEKCYRLPVSILESIAFAAR